MASKTIPQLTAVSVPADDDLVEISQGGASFKATAAQLVEGSGLALTAISSGQVISNVSGSSAVPIGNTMSAILDDAVGDTQGQIIYRNATAWTALDPGSAGEVLTSGGAAADVSWGAAGGGITPMNDFDAGVPALSNFTWMNQNSATATNSSPSGKAIFAQAGAASGTDDINFLYLTSLPSTPYTITAYLQSVVDPGGFCAGNILGWSDGTKLQVMRLGGNNDNTVPALVVTNFTNVTTFSANVFTEEFFATTPMWQQVADDGTNIAFRISLDGVNFVTLYSVAKASGYLGSGGYTRVGWGVSRRTSWSIAPWTTLRYWSTATPAFP